MHREIVQPIMEQKFREVTSGANLDLRHRESGARIAGWFDTMVRVGYPDPLWQMFMPNTLSVSGGYSLDGPHIPRQLVLALLTSATYVAPDLLYAWKTRVLKSSTWDLDVMLAQSDPQFQRVCAVAKNFTI